MEMVDFRLLNGAKKVTVIETFDGRGIIVSPGGRREFESLEQCKKYILGSGFETNIHHLFGPSLKREVRKGE